MSNALYRTGLRVVVPAVPARPAREAYSYFITETYRDITPAPTGWAYKDVVNQFDGSVSRQLVFIGNGPRTEQNTTTIVREVFVPADPGTAGSDPVILMQPARGWTAFARSIGAVREGYGEFKVSPLVEGVAVGFTTRAEDPTPGYGHLTHGLVFTGGIAYNLRTGENYGAFAATDVFRITVDDDNVLLEKNTVDLDTESSTYPAAAPLFLGAALHAQGDFLTDPVLHVTTPAVFPAFDNTGAPVFDDFAGFGADRQDNASAVIVLDDFTVSAYGSLIPVVPANGASVLLDDFMAVGLLVPGTIGGAAVVIDDFAAIGSDILGALGRPTFDDFGAYGYQEPNDEGFMFETARITDTLTAAGLKDVSMFTTALVVTTMAGARMLDALMNTTAQVQTLMLGGLTVDAQMFTLARVSDSLATIVVGGEDTSTPGVTDDGSETWVLNLNTQGSTEYTNYGFNSYARIGQKYYGASEAGLIELDGDDDTGTPIHASFSLGLLDAGSPQRKVFTNCYIGVSSKGTLFVKVRADDEEYIYEARDWSEKMKQQRVDLGKGMKANYIGLEIHNSEGCDFEIDTVEFLMAELKRKIGG